jgi:hypothetical protein
MNRTTDLKMLAESYATMLPTATAVIVESVDIPEVKADVSDYMVELLKY